MISKRIGAVIGLGERGRYWAGRLSANGWKISAFDADTSIAPKGVGLASGIKECVEAADLIIVCLPERISLIRKVVQTIQGAVKPGNRVIIVSELDLKHLRGCATRPDEIFRVLGCEIDQKWRSCRRNFLIPVITFL